MSIGETVLYGVAASLVASATFFAFLLGLRPRFDISPSIAREDKGAGRIAYRFKVVNRTRRAMVDVTVQLYRDTPVKVPGGKHPVRTLKAIELVHSNPVVIPGKRMSDSEFRNARRFVAGQDILQVWPNEQQASLLLRITCKDGLTGTFRQQEHTFRLHSEIEDGTFAFGKSLKVTR